MSNVSDEYRIIADRAGWVPKTARGRLRVEGRDAVSFLHALLSNEIQTLHDGEGAYATYLTPQGRMIADVIVYQCGDHVLLDVPSGQGPALAARFDQVIFTEDVSITDVSGEVDQIAIIGGGADEAIARALSADASQLHALPLRSHRLAGDVRIARTDDALLPSFDLFVKSSEREKVVEQLAAVGVVPLSAALADALRIDAGRPAFGVDMTDETIPLEAGLLDRAISQTKGCYVGQEVIIRVLHRGGGRVARRLVRLAFDPAVANPPAAGTPLRTEAGDTGRVTSAAFSPRAGRVLGLGYVHRDVAEAGRHLTAGDAAVEILGLAG
jgi:tRNA-modifying protein YgfZ